VTLRTVWRATLTGAACALLPARAGRAQISATVDLGASAVRYDGFLLSGAAALTPAFAWDGPRGGLALRGTYLRFESGNRSLQGSVTGSLFTRPTGVPGWRGEVSAEVGASSYADFASFWHAIGEVRLHRASAGHGVWIAATAGRTSFGSDFVSRPVIAATIAAWVRRDRFMVLTSAHRAYIGDTSYSDINLTARGQRGAVALEMGAGARFFSRGGGRGVFGEGSAIIALNHRLALILGGGRHPTDPVRGSIAGRYATIAMRMRLRPSPVSRPRPPMLSSRGANGDASAALALRVLPQRDGLVRLVLSGGPADFVEIAGDFTEWQAVPLRRTPGGNWETAFRLARGLHRMNARIDGGPWIVPAGTTRLADDYDGEVGIFIVP
jgi:hypothetical protein